MGSPTASLPPGGSKGRGWAHLTAGRRPSTPTWYPTS
eukprot:CAMPEP_0182896644 /NCGR_PEP_ID=MMETSP0034_2-20130328/26403_1 /TAXON_ID=156128 /ORGANISM="Nephroselmis pyriformis, Strain CCMP717" /LENGTH=36 /DNA_ID= /DNA_START= /DNA_END= /DNA_ORIENTATION=